MAMLLPPKALCLLLLPLLFLSSARSQLLPFRGGLFDRLFNPEKLVGGSQLVRDATVGNDGGVVGDEGERTAAIDEDPGFRFSLFGSHGGDDAEDASETEFEGKWELVSKSSGVSAMHLQLLPNNKALIFDSTVLGPSKIRLAKNMVCPVRPQAKAPDCWAHAVIYDIETRALRPLSIITDPWCSSGGLGADGNFVSTGGFDAGSQSVRFLGLCDNCNWRDTPNVLGNGRWYSTQTKLEDGAFIVMGGRRSYSYEFVTVNNKISAKTTFFPFLEETTDLDENNLYPFVNLLPDGNLFVFANSRSIILDARRNKIIREFPRLIGGSRNYPASGMSALLPMVLKNHVDSRMVKAEVIVCGGAKSTAYRAVEKNNMFMPALQDCARLVVTDPNAQWQKEAMPSRRVMGDMLILPTGDLLMLNGATKGTAAWNFAEDPNYVPVLYSPQKPAGERFRELKAATIPRMYHSTSMVLPDGRILVAGSNTNPTYQFTNVPYPTELRMEKFSPPYLNPALQKYRPEIVAELTDKKMGYNRSFYIKFRVNSDGRRVRKRDVKVTMYAPPFTTHGYSMNQRLLQLANTVLRNEGGIYHLDTKSPPSGTIAPPGHYLVFVVYKGVPSVGAWVQIQ
ncbi:aldehyde oxidase GLOX1-like [Rhodamnia argentea]|uniref:Aldehyde oxidase GLOX1-like n=1 Tax=Rhodamnia argentea TaxID=178133 RepID=A0A8B8Q3T1_9MYRT|nr:aldehyde oxidase GLOX1-like [Rhodamnia argentea]